MLILSCPCFADDTRGWCVFEQGVATIVLAHCIAAAAVGKLPESTRAADAVRRKLIDISSDLSAPVPVETRERAESELRRITHAVQYVLHEYKTTASRRHWQWHCTFFSKSRRTSSVDTLERGSLSPPHLAHQ